MISDKQIPLSKCIDFIVDNRGKTAPTSDSGIPLIATNCIDNENLYPVFRNIRYVSEDTYKNWFRAHPLEGDIIFTLKGTPGRVCLVPENVGFVIAQDMVSIRVNFDKIYPLYLFAALRSRIVQHQIKTLDTSGVIPNLKKSDFDKVLIPNTDPNTQKYIGDLYHSLSLKAEHLKKQNKTLETMAQTIFKEWFGKHQIGDELPEGWRVGKLGEEFKIIMGQSPSGSSYNELGEGDVFFQGRAEFTSRFPSVRLFTTEPKRMASKFDVLVSVRAPVGDINVAHTNCCIGRGLAAVSSENKSYSLYKLKHLKPIFDLFESEGTVFGSINKRSFESIETIIPKIDRVKEFNDHIKSTDLKIYENYNQIQSLTKTRDTLLPKLMSGQVRVKNIKQTADA